MVAPCYVNHNHCTLQLEMATKSSFSPKAGGRKGCWLLGLEFLRFSSTQPVLPEYLLCADITGAFSLHLVPLSPVASFTWSKESSPQCLASLCCFIFSKDVLFHPLIMLTQFCKGEGTHQQGKVSGTNFQPSDTSNFNNGPQIVGDHCDS